MWFGNEIGGWCFYVFSGVEVKKKTYMRMIFLFFLEVLILSS